MVFSNFVTHALQNETVGQEYAVAALTRAVTLAFAGLRRRGDVLGVLLFLGPASSGKTHMARTLARVLTGGEQVIAYVNCQQLGEASDHLVSLEGQLAPAYRKTYAQNAIANGFQLVVFEEIDKAPHGLRDDLALAIDCGRISTPGLVFPLRNSFVILISDLSRKKADQLVGRTIGFFLDGEPAVEMSRRQAVALEEVDSRLGPRLVSRIDEIVVFERLSQQNIITLLERKLGEIERYLAGWCIGFMIEHDAKTFLLKEGLEDLNHGARQITRVVRNYLEFPIADLMLSGRLNPGTTVTVKHDQTRSFLNFEIMIPGIAPAKLPAGRALGVQA
ncbi:MAG TPA: AAA family ATPase [Blastocatellia bacterium]|nr:AAA family ATPase [Blastocatellia bacterium]